MLYKLRQRAQDERGFTLIELLVVILIIGILAAIAIPSFLNQTTKAYDASAKELARTAQTTGLTFGTDDGNAFTGITSGTLQGYESTILTSGNSSANNAYLYGAGGSGGTFWVISASAKTPADYFEVVDNTTTGTVTRTCGTATPSAQSGATAPTMSFSAGTGPTSGGCVNGAW